MEIKELTIQSIQPDPNQPRKSFQQEEIQELAASYPRLGQLVPIIVVLIAAGVWKIIDGERRWRAAQLAGLLTLRAIILEKEPDASELCDLQLTINCERRDLNPIEQMEACKKLMHAKGLNATGLASHLKKSKSAITRILALDQLSEEERQLVIDGRLGSSSAYSLTRMETDARHEAVTAKTKVPTKRQLDEIAKKESSISQTKQHQLRYELENCSITIRSERVVTADDLVIALNELLRACKKAKGQQLDLSTLSLVLHDQATARRKQQAGAKDVSISRLETTPSA